MRTSHPSQKYDLVIVGGGVSGTALLYTLSKYSDLKNICLIEKYKGFGLVNSAAGMNSQTLHFGDIETNYSLEKAKSVKKYADMVKIYLEKEKQLNPEKKIFSKYSKMVLAVGRKQVEKLDKRFDTFGKLFPNLRKIGKEEIGQIEPRIIDGRKPDQELLALATIDGYTVDFGGLAKSFVENARKLNNDISIQLNNKLLKIVNKDNRFVITTQKGTIEAPVVAVAAGGHSIKIAKSLGYGKNLSILSMAGSFFIGPKVLNGKVYTMQQKKLPFAAIHGDPDVYDHRVTRFGPTAKPVLMLERYNYNSFWEYLTTFGFSFRAIMSLLKVSADWTIFKYLFRNVMYDLPVIGKYNFLKQVKKIVPKIKYDEIKYAKHIGGTRPQIVNNDKMKLQMGEAKIVGENIIFNITPSPGASTCLGNAYVDCQKIMEFYGDKFKFDEQAFQNDLFEKE